MGSWYSENRYNERCGELNASFALSLIQSSLALAGLKESIPFRYAGGLVVFFDQMDNPYLEKNDMKFRTVISLAALMAATSTISTVDAQTGDSGQRKVHHVVVVWLKQAGDENARRQYIEESKHIAELPGVLSYEIGSPAAIKRGHASAALDESYDVAVSSTYESQQAFEDFLKNPEYVRIAQQVLKPLVDKYKVYDFIE